MFNGLASEQAVITGTATVGTYTCLRFPSPGTSRPRFATRWIQKAQKKGSILRQREHWGASSALPLPGHRHINLNLDWLDPLPFLIKRPFFLQPEQSNTFFFFLAILIYSGGRWEGTCCTQTTKKQQKNRTVTIIEQWIDGNPTLPRARASMPPCASIISQARPGPKHWRHITSVIYYVQHWCMQHAELNQMYMHAHLTRSKHLVYSTVGARR